MGETATRIDIETLKRRVGIADAVRAFCPGIRLRRQGSELVGLSPFKAERTPSFTVDPRRNVFFCFATDQGGDAVRFVEILEGCEFPESARRLAAKCLGDVPLTADDRQRDKARAERREAEQREVDARDRAEQDRRIATAKRIWSETVPARGSIVETYLMARGVDLDALHALYGWRVPPALRFHANTPIGSDGDCGPAMIGAMRDAGGAFTGIHRTFLRADGTGKARMANAKLTLGRVWGSFTVLAPAEFETLPATMGGEGYETTMTVMAALARRGRRVSAISGLSLGNIAGAGLGSGGPHPVLKGRRMPSQRPDPARPGLLLPAHVKQFVILEDADGSDPLSARARISRAVAKFRVQGLRVATATPAAGEDFNDMAQS